MGMMPRTPEELIARFGALITARDLDALVALYEPTAVFVPQPGVIVAGHDAIELIAFYGWYFAANWAGFTFDRHANLEAWFRRVGARPAVARGVTIPSGLPDLPPRKRV